MVLPGMGVSLVGYQGTFFGYTINESNGFYLEQVGSFDAPVSNFTSITYDGSSFLVSALDGSNTIYRIGYDGEILNEYTAGTWELNRHKVCTLIL